MPLRFHPTPVARILVIDDEPSVLAAIEQALKPTGHQVILAAEAAAGLQRHRAEPVDLIITDLYMPDQDGIETIVQLRRSDPQVPIIAMSGNAKSDMLTVAKKLGAVAALEKPFAIDQLLKVAEKALKRN